MLHLLPRFWRQRLAARLQCGDFDFQQDDVLAQLAQHALAQQVFFHAGKFLAFQRAARFATFAALVAPVCSLVSFPNACTIMTR